MPSDIALKMNDALVRLRRAAWTADEGTAMAALERVVAEAKRNRK